MATVTLTPGETALLKAIVGRLTVKSRTGELGIMHGADRFVSTQLILKAGDRSLLEAIARKVGGSVTNFDG